MANKIPLGEYLAAGLAIGRRTSIDFEAPLDEWQKLDS
jgi:hypothetical protein